MLRRLLLSVLIVLCGARVLFAADQKACANAPIVTFDHTAKSDLLSASIRRSDGEQFIIRVVKTAPKQFTYVVTGATAVPQDASKHDFAKGDDETTHDECVTHSKQYGGYIMKVEKTGESTLTNKTLLVFVETDDWNFELSGAFTVSGLQDPIWSLQAQGGGNYKVVAITDTATDKKLDPVRLGVASFVSVFHSSRPRVGITFGLGIDEGKRPTYYAGPTIRLGKVAGITGGVALGSVKRLPNSISEGGIVTDVNALNDLPTRTATAWFFALSYSFLGSSDKLKAPFAGQ